MTKSKKASKTRETFEWKWNNGTMEPKIMFLDHCLAFIHFINVKSIREF